MFRDETKVQAVAAPCDHSLQLLDFLQFVEAAQKKQVGDLLDDFERIGNASRPKGIPDCIDLTTNFPGEHAPTFGLQLDVVIASDKTGAGGRT